MPRLDFLLGRLEEDGVDRLVCGHEGVHVFPVFDVLPAELGVFLGNASFFKEYGAYQTIVTYITHLWERTQIS